jgi:HSP20 family protein
MNPSRKVARAGLTDLAVLQREINQLFESLAEFDRTERPAAGEWLPPVDVYESRGRVVVVVEVPGIPPDSLRVFHQSHRLVVTGERRERHPGGAPSCLCLERPQGRFTRTIHLDIPVDIQQGDASLSGGLLVVTFPRLRDRRGRETVIKVRHLGGDR